MSDQRRLRLEGKVALITGAGSGIGEASAKLFAAEGARVGVADIAPEAAERVAGEVRAAGGDAIALQGDVAESAEAEAMVAGVVQAWGRLDILFNNAGVSCVGALHDTSEEEWDRVVRVNVRGVYMVSRWAVPVMLRQQSGVIINMSSSIAEIGLAQRAAYAASKGAVLALTRSMQADYAAHGIRINALLPGTIYTPFVEGYLQKHFSDRREEAMANLRRRQASGTLGTPEDVAYAALYLASDEAKFVYGSGLVIDGGVTGVKV